MRQRENVAIMIVTRQTSLDMSKQVKSKKINSHRNDEERSRTIWNSRLFHYVIAVEECGTISSAARTLFLSQPALTKQIGKLESELGFQIFDRSKNPLGITEQGEIFLDFAGRYLELEKEFQQKLDAVSGEKHQDLIVMTTSRGGMYAGVRTSAFLDAHPEIHVEYHNTDARSCEEMLESEERELAVYTDPVQSDRIEYLPLEEDPLLLVIPKDSPALEGVEIGENSYQNPLEIDVECLRRQITALFFPHRRTVCFLRSRNYFGAVEFRWEMHFMWITLTRATQSLVEVVGLLWCRYRR